MRYLFILIFLIRVSHTANAKPVETKIHAYAKGDRWYFKLPMSVLYKDVLFVTRITGNAYEYEVYGAGKVIHEPVMARWEKRHDHLVLRMMMPHLVTDGDEPIYEAVRNNNVAPVLQRFKIDPASDENNFVIDVTDFFVAGVPWLRPQVRLGLSAFDKSRSEILSARNHEEYVQLTQRLTFKSKGLPDNPTDLLSIELNHAMVLLPEDKMTSRSHMQGLPVQTVDQLDYGVKDYVPGKNKWIERWRLVPSDWDAFEKGTLVKPVKPIVYYIDPATPEKWRPYIKQGVEAWLPVFERIGFHDAIQVREPPSLEEDPDWSIDNFEHASIRYVTGRGVAHGPSIADPRTGEILNASIQWGHEKLASMADRLFVETAAANPDARGCILKDEVMGKLIKQVITHEVGHTLGLTHYFSASNHYPVDSLRSPTFTHSHGLSASIMDYAWGNYVAQPDDSLVNFYPQLGDYDEWMIHYLYTPLRGITHPDQESDSLHHWMEQAPVPVSGGYWDDLGDDAIRASTLGLSNLQLIIQNLEPWSGATDKEQLKKIYLKVLKQYGVYVENVLMEWMPTRVSQEGYADLQTSSLAFFDLYFFKSPDWLINEQALHKIGSRSFINSELNDLQKKVLYDIVFKRSSYFISMGKSEQALALMRETGELVFKNRLQANAMEFNLHQIMINFATDILTGNASTTFQSYELTLVARQALMDWRKQVRLNLKKAKDEMLILHWQHMLAEIETALQKRTGS